MDWFGFHVWMDTVTVVDKSTTQYARVFATVTSNLGILEKLGNLTNCDKIEIHSPNFDATVKLVNNLAYYIYTYLETSH